MQTMHGTFSFTDIRMASAHLRRQWHELDRIGSHALALLKIAELNGFWPQLFVQLQGVA